MDYHHDMHQLDRYHVHQKLLPKTKDFQKKNGKKNIPSKIEKCWLMKILLPWHQSDYHIDRLGYGQFHAFWIRIKLNFHKTTHTDR